MNYKIMRILLLFDLPMETSSERKEYAKFRKCIMAEGFIMLQKSVYSKLSLNASATELILNNVRKIKPQYGLVQIITITENQYQKMENIIGESNTNIIDCVERVIVL